MTNHVSIRIILLTVYICKAELPKLHRDYFYSGCNEVRYVNNAIYYQVEFQNHYVENCVLKFYGYPANTYNVCASIVHFSLPCENNRRLALVFMKDKVSTIKEFDCSSKEIKKDYRYCGMFVYMYLRTKPYSNTPYKQQGSILLIKVKAVARIGEDSNNQSELNIKKANSRISLDEIDEEKDSTRVTITIALATSAGVFLICSISLLIYGLKRRRSRNSTFQSYQNGHTGRPVVSNTTRPNIAYRWVASPNEYVQLQSNNRQQTEEIPTRHISNRDSAETVSLQSDVSNDLTTPTNDEVYSHQETPYDPSGEYHNIEDVAEQSPPIENTNSINPSNLTTGLPGPEDNTDLEDMNDDSQQSTAYQAIWD